MGASASKTSSTSTISDITNIILETMIKNSSNCESVNDQSGKQSTVISGSTVVGDISQTLTQVSDFTCIQTVSNDAKFANDLKVALENYASSKATASATIGISVSSSTTKNVSSVVSNVTNKTTIDNIKSCVGKAKQTAEQQLTVLGSTITGDLTQVMTQQAVVSCIQSDANVMSAITALSKDISSSSITEAFSGISTTASVVALIVCVIVCVMLGPLCINKLL